MKKHKHKTELAGTTPRFTLLKIKLIFSLKSKY